MLQCGAMVIDTLGMRELGMWDVSDGMGEAFADVGAFLGKCRFRDCAHGKEPGCAIRAAIASGELDASRWESYRRLGSEAEYSDDQNTYLRKKQRRGKDIRKSVKKKRKEVW